ncbi:hypothetical protein BDW59DRAFT_158307 [Aspergillus cavernicola]|uniref:AT hook motif protein n=1 Tax=Aspergillus cavernicola TaxID=176166 RepID=A0ABR4ISW9_9EURO
MPMSWNAEADAKLLLAVLNQVKDAKLKLDYVKIAQFMGSDCIPGAVQNRIVRLRRKAEGGDGGGENGAYEGDSVGSPGTPLKGSASVSGSPQKRKGQKQRKATPKTTPKGKKIKTEIGGGGYSDEDSELDVKKVKAEVEEEEEPFGVDAEVA